MTIKFFFFFCQAYANYMPTFDIKYLQTVMKKILKIFFLSLFSLIITIAIFFPEDPAWIKCSDEKDLYRYVYDGWKVEKVIKDYKNEYPRIWMSKKGEIKALNFGNRCYHLEGAELNFKKGNIIF